MRIRHRVMLSAMLVRSASSLARPSPSRAKGLASSSTLAALSSPSSAPAFALSSRLQGLDKPTVWHEFSPLAVAHGAVNLGQGFPDWEPPPFVQEAMKQAVDPAYNRHANQYARPYAHLPLAQVLAGDYSQRLCRDVDPATNVATAVGCTNVLYCALHGLLSPGDEVILLEPAFDIYASQVRMAGGTPVFVPLRPTGDVHAGASAVFTLDMKELEAAVTDKTRAILLNTPHNPTGKVFSLKELQGMAAIVQKHAAVTLISDEVYEHIVFDPVLEPHISIASLPGMWEQTLTLSSAGKTFSCTGWKVGWAVGPAHLVKAVTAVQQWVNFSAPTPNQDAIAVSLLQAKQPYQGFDSYYTFLAAEYKRKRQLLAAALEAAGMTPVIPPGGFFIMADTSAIDLPDSYLEEVTEAMPVTPMPRDWAMSRWLTKEVGVTAIPPSAFYSADNVPLAKNFLRFAYCKGDDTLLEAHRRLEAYFGK